MEETTIKGETFTQKKQKKEHVMFFTCASCGEIDPTFVCYESCHSICTLCGTVVLESPWETLITHDADEPSEVPKHVLRILNDLELEPANVWWNVIHQQQQKQQPQQPQQQSNKNKRTWTPLRVFQALFAQGSVHPARLVEYAHAVYKIPAEKIVKPKETESHHQNDQDLYKPLMIRLSEVVDMSYADRQQLYHTIRMSVAKNPVLETKMPNAVVLAAWCKMRGIISVNDHADVCRWMNIGVQTVRKLIPLI